MGVDLRLLPIDGSNGEWAYSHTVLNVNRDSDLFNVIEMLPSVASLTSKFNSWCGENGYGRTIFDAYGDELRTVLASDLALVLPVLEPAPVRAYLDALEPDTRIVLYWH